jgi:hypothetical protein
MRLGHGWDTQSRVSGLADVVFMTVAHDDDQGDTKRCVARKGGEQRQDALATVGPRLTPGPRTGYRPTTDVRHLSLYLPGMTDPGD